MPPSEGPMTVSSRSMPSARTRLVAAARDVLDREVRKAQAVALAGRRIHRGGPGGAEAAAERIDADDEEAVGSRSRAPGPPCPATSPRRGSCAEAAACADGERPGEQQDRVVARGVERSPGLVGDARAVQRAAAPHAGRDRAAPRSGAHPSAAALAASRGPCTASPQGSGSLPSAMPSNSGVDR